MSIDLLEAPETVVEKRPEPPKCWRNWYRTTHSCTSTCSGCGAVERIAAGAVFSEHHCQPPYPSYEVAEAVALESLANCDPVVREKIEYLGPKAVKE